MLRYIEKNIWLDQQNFVGSTIVFCYTDNKMFS